MKTFYSCLVDTNPKFHYQCWLWVHSLIEMAKIQPKDIWVHYSTGVNTTFLNKLESLGVEIKEVSSFGDGKYCNKIAQLSNKSLQDADIIILMDTDIIVTEDFSKEMNTNCISGKIVDLPNPEISVLDKIFMKAGIRNSCKNIKTDFSEEMTYAANFNGGLYVIPQKYIEEIRPSWEKWALWLLNNKFLHDVGVDQVSFCMAIHENKIPVKHLDRRYNFPTYINFYKNISPVVIHYHGELNELALLKIDTNSSNDYKNCVNEVNEIVKRHFDNEIFWNYRYSVNPELGSGVGSRGDNLKTKQDYLKRLKVEDYSVLDIGFGDLKLMKDLNIKSYVGIDSSDEAIYNAKLLRQDWKFIKAGSISSEEVPLKDYVVCFDVLIYQKRKEDFNNLIALMISKVKKRLLVSGYTNKQKHHDTNHMLAYHQSLYQTLKNSNKFESVIKLFQINDTDYYSCDLEFDKDFWKKFFKDLLIDKIPKLEGKKIYLHIGTPKTGTSSLQGYLLHNKEELYKQRYLYSKNVVGNKHQSLVTAMLKDDWWNFIQFFEKEKDILGDIDTLIISSEGFYNHIDQFSKVAKLFWQVISEVSDLKVIVYLRGQDKFLESFYRQCVTCPKNGDEIYGQDLDIGHFWEKKRVEANLDYETSINSWSQIVGNDKVVVRPYKGDIIKDFLQLLAIDNSCFRKISKQNISLHPIIVELIRRCNSFLDVNSQKMLVKEIRDLHSKNKLANFEGAEDKNIKLLLIEEELIKRCDGFLDKHSQKKLKSEIKKLLSEHELIKSFVNDELKEAINKKYADSNKRLVSKWPEISSVLIDHNVSNRMQLDNKYEDCTSASSNKGFFRHINLFKKFIKEKKSNNKISRIQLERELLNSTRAPNDMSSGDMKKAIKDIEYPYEFFETVTASRKVLGWYTKHFPRIYEYPWLLNKLKQKIHGKLIADFGAGLSPIPILLTKYGAKVTTIDNHTKIRTKEELFNANEWGYFNYGEINKHITSLNLTIDENTFAKESFDMWYSISVVEHMPAKIRRQVFNWMRNTLKTDGRLLLTVDLVKGTDKLWNYAEGKMIEEIDIHGTIDDIIKELIELGFVIYENRIINLPDSERIDIGLIDASLTK